MRFEELNIPLYFVHYFSDMCYVREKNTSWESCVREKNTKFSQVFSSTHSKTRTGRIHTCFK